MCDPAAAKPFMLAVVACSLLAGALAGSSTPAEAASTLGARYQNVASVGSDQAQVIYYRAAGDGKGVANVYLDREFITALKPGGHVAFCLAPGRHILGAYLDDAPRYAGKNEELYAASLNGGSTYYLKVREEDGNLPLPVAKRDAVAELEGSRRQIHLLSRASGVQVCRHYATLDVPPATVREFSLLADTAFNSQGGLTDAGRKALKGILDGLQREGASISRVEVDGHTDPLASVASNQLQGQRMADAVRAALISNGLPQSLVTAISSGSRAMVKLGCYGTQAEQVACNAPNRRVVLRMEVKVESRP